MTKKSATIAAVALVLASIVYAQSPNRFRFISQQTTINEISKSGSASSVELVAANPDRVKLECSNDSTATLYMRRSTSDAAISAGNYSIAIGPGGFWEDPQPVYDGEYNIIWDAADGFITCAEGEL